MRRAVSVSATVLWMGLIFLASSLPGGSTGPDTLLWTLVLKVLHFLIFGVLAVLFLTVLRGKRNLAGAARILFLVSFLLTVLYAASDEYHQRFSPGRHASVRDVVIDALGAAVFLRAAAAWRTKKPGNKEHLVHAETFDRR
jgi:VanZ family protein